MSGIDFSSVIFVMSVTISVFSHSRTSSRAASPVGVFVVGSLPGPTEHKGFQNKSGQQRNHR
jgi:hypothetical protein